MIKMKHTPGPWRAVETPYGPIDIFGASAESVVTVYRSDGRDPVMRRANARLIAAAPEMYEALKGFVAKLDTAILVEGDHPTSHLADELRAALAALAKAEGRDSA